MDHGLTKVKKHPFTSVVERGRSIAWMTALMSKKFFWLSRQNGSRQMGYNLLPSIISDKSNIATGIAINSCMHCSCYYQLGVTTSVWACEDTGAELT